MCYYLTLMFVYTYEQVEVGDVLLFDTVITFII